MSALRKVLVVDDDPVIGVSFNRVLSRKGYAVITAGSGQEALTKLASEKYDLVFTDIKMPGMDGLEVAERVKASQPWVPVVIVTGYGTQDHEDRAEAAGVCGFLRKPLSPDLIEYSAQQALRNREVAAARPAEIAPRHAAARGQLKNIALFIAAPFIGLAYILAFPLVGAGMVAWMGVQAAARHPLGNRIGTIARTVGLCIASPFLGLAYVLLFPFIGLAMLAWMGARALVGRSRPE